MINGASTVTSAVIATSAAATTDDQRRDRAPGLVASLVRSSWTSTGMKTEVSTPPSTSS